MKRPYVPDAGDLVWLTFDPQAEREQKGRRPALVLSPRAFNAKASLAVVCPITSKVKGRMLEVLVRADRIDGAVLATHIKSLDWQERHAEFAGKADAATLDEVRERLRPLLGL